MCILGHGNGTPLQKNKSIARNSVHVFGNELCMKVTEGGLTVILHVLQARCRLHRLAALSSEMSGVYSPAIS